MLLALLALLLAPALPHTEEPGKAQGHVTRLGPAAAAGLSSGAVPLPRLAITPHPFGRRATQRTMVRAGALLARGALFLVRRGLLRNVWYRGSGDASLPAERPRVPAPIFQAL